MAIGANEIGSEAWCAAMSVVLADVDQQVAAGPNQKPPNARAAKTKVAKVALKPAEAKDPPERAVRAS